MSDHIDVSGGTTAVLSAMVRVAQLINVEFEELSMDCGNANGQGGCLINTADGCKILSCPLGRRTE